MQLLNNFLIAQRPFQDIQLSHWLPANSSHSVHSLWAALKSTIIGNCEKPYGFSAKENQEWIDENDQEAE